jgi:carboxyvinyl-carboxyphosphonate phosphorylmutase
MAEDIGFKYGMIGGSVISMNLLGAPDVMLITLTELVDSVRNICRSSKLKILVDGDAGYGNHINVKRLVEEVESAGASGITLEDTLIPTPYNSSEIEIISASEQVKKLQTALNTRKSENFGIIARTQMLDNESLHDFLQRIQLYSTLEIDAICLFGNRACDQIEKVSSLTEKPIMLITYKNHNKIIKNINPNVKLILKGHQPFQASLKTAYQ